MKAIKKLFKIIFWTLVVLLVVLLALPLWIGPLGKFAANKTVPGIIKTDFKLGELGLNPYSGSFSIGDMHIANPKNFAKENCVDLTRLSAKVDVPSTFTHKIHIEHITLDGLYLRTTPLAENFKQLAKDASGEETPQEGAPTAEVQQPQEVAKSEEQTGGEPAEEYRVVIDRIVLSNLTLNYSGLPIPIPTLTIEGIGADKEEGASLEDVAVAVWEAILKATGKVGAALQSVGNGALDVGQGALDSGANALDAVKNVDMQGISDSANKLKESAKDLKNLFKNNK